MSYTVVRSSLIAGTNNKRPHNRLMWSTIRSSFIYWTMDINGYLVGREKRLANQRQCWSMTL